MQIVKFKNPHTADEATERFAVIEDRGPRVLVELICGMAIRPQSVYPAQDLVPVDPLDAAVHAARAATTVEQLGAIYADLVGYDHNADCPGRSLDELRGDILDFVREFCYAEGRHVSEVGL